MLDRHKPKIRSVETSYLRDACGVTRRDRMMSVDLRERCGVDGDVLGSIRRNTLRWFGHMERMDDERLTKRVYKSKVEGERVRGRPRMRWMDGVKTYVNESRKR